MHRHQENIRRKEILHPCHIPRDNQIFVEKRINGYVARKCVVDGVLEPFGPDPPPPQYSQYGHATVTLDNGDMFFASLWIREGYQDHGLHADEEITYSCIIKRTNYVDLTAMLWANPLGSHVSRGTARIDFVNRHGDSYVGELLPVQDVEVEILPPKKRDTYFSGSSSRAPIFIP